MLFSCSYCGKIHEKKFVCKNKKLVIENKKMKRIYNKDKDKNETKFRRTNAWTKKAIEIKERDNYCCVVCREGLYDIGERKYNTKNLEVHHIDKLKDNLKKGLDNYNLITLCATHHRMADNGEIKKEILKELVQNTYDKIYSDIY